MSTSNCILLLLLLSVHGSIQQSNPSSLTYRAAVLELKPIKYTNNATEMLIQTAERIVRFVEQAAEREVDIVVFPEISLSFLTLGGRSDLVDRSILVPDPSPNYAPCRNSSIPVSEILKKIACAADQNDIYVVVNLLEKELCSLEDCYSDGIIFHPTSVVFDRDGKLIARSRKAHVFGRDGLLDDIATPELSTFDTDFGVTFGSIVCFDIMFEDTFLTLTRKLNITDIVFPTGWFSSMPFLTAIQVQAGLAYAEDVNLLSSAYNNIASGNSGSGIFAGRQGVVRAILSLHPHEEMLIVDVQKKNKNVANNQTVQLGLGHDRSPANLDHEHHKHHKHHVNVRHSHWKRDAGDFKWTYDKLDEFQTKLIAENGFTVQRLSHAGVQCEFRVNITNLDLFGVTYRLVAFDGLPILSSLPLGTRICAVVLCANDTIDSCGHTWDTPAILNSIEITAINIDNARTLMMPNTLGSDMMPFKNLIWDEYKHEDRIHTSMSLTTPTQDLITFGIWGRNFDKDPRKSVSRIVNP